MNVKKIFDCVSFLIETIICCICYIFISAIISFILYFLIEIISKDIIAMCYIAGIITMILIILSLAYISNYNKKYRKNDNNSSKRQNDFFFEEDIRMKEERYSDKRNT